MQHATGPWGTTMVYVIVFAIIALRMIRMTGTRPIRLHSLWVRPAIFAVIAVMLVFTAPPHGMVQGLIVLAALGVGAFLGWHQGKLMALTVDREKGTLQVRASVWATLFIFAVILLRVGLRTWLMEAQSPLHAYLGVITDASVLFIVGLYGARATEMFIRGRALLAAHAASGQPG